MATPTPELIGSPLPAISVILPVLNEEAHLQSAVHSILSQDYQGAIEVILAIGPSHDRTLEIAQEMSGKDSRVVLVDSPTGRTPGARVRVGGDTGVPRGPRRLGGGGREPLQRAQPAVHRVVRLRVGR